MTTGDSVVLLHGIFRTYRSMRPLEKYFSDREYQVINVDYPSCKKNIDGLADYLRDALDSHKTETSQKLHFIGYSLGGLILRAYIKKYRPVNMGRVVQLGPPNQGSEIADLVQKWFLYKYLYGPAGQQLVTDQSAFGHLFGDVDYELGIIAGTHTVDPLSWLIIPGANDGKVAVVRTKLPGMKDHITLPASHTFMLSNNAVKQQALHFIEHGIFYR